MSPLSPGSIYRKHAAAIAQGDWGEGGAGMKSIPVRIDEFLLRVITPQTARQIATAIGAELSTVKSALSRHRESLWSLIGDGRDARCESKARLMLRSFTL